MASLDGLAGLCLLAWLAADEVVEALAELDQEPAGDGEDDHDPEEDDDGEGEEVEELRAEVGGGLAVEVDLLVDGHGPVGADDWKIDEDINMR
ncbi:unnamed protein product [Sphagnum tenellum]